MSSRTHRFVLTYFSSVFGTVIVTLFSIISTPIILRSLGTEAFGAFRTSSDWLAYLSIFEFGLRGALYPMLAKADSDNDTAQKSLIVAMGVRLYLPLSLLMIVLGFCLSFFIPDLIRIPSDLRTNLQLGLGVGLIGFLLYPLLTLQIFAQVIQKGYIVNLFLLLQSVIITSLAVVFSVFKLSVAGQYLAVFIGNLVYYLSLIIYLYYSQPEIFVNFFSNRRNEYQTEIKQQLWNNSWQFFAVDFCGRLSLMTDNILISSILGPGVVASFFLTQRLPMLILSQVQPLSSSSCPALINLYHQGEIEVFKTRILELTKLICTVGIGLLIPVTIYNHDFVSLWIGGNNFAGESVTILAAINGLLLAVFSLWTSVLLGTGHVSSLTPIIVFSTIVNFTLSAFLTFLIGKEGPLLGTFIAFITTYLCLIPILFKKLFGIDIKSIIKSMIYPFLLGIPCALFCWKMSQINVYGWLGLALKMSLSVVIYFIFSWVLILSRNEKDFCKNKARKILSKL